jgi:hypothetical protein
MSRVILGVLFLIAAVVFLGGCYNLAAHAYAPPPRPQVLVGAAQQPAPHDPAERLDARMPQSG